MSTDTGTDWEAVRHDYVYSKTKEPLSEVAARHGLPYDRAWYHYHNEGWKDLREKFWDDYRARKYEATMAAYLGDPNGLAVETDDYLGAAASEQE